MPTKSGKTTPAQARAALARIADDLWAPWRTFAIAAAYDLDVFSHIASGKQTAAQIAAAAGCSASAMRRLLDAMVAVKYLKRSGDHYSLEPVAEMFFVKGGELYMDGASWIARGLLPTWSQLAEVVRTGKSAVPQAGGPPIDLLKVLVRQIFPMSHLGSQDLVRKLGRAAVSKFENILDVAAGSGAWSLAFVRANPRARATALDFPPILEVTREYADRFGVGDRYSYIEGSQYEANWGSDAYDLVIFGHIVHSESTEQAQFLIGRAYQALHAGGTLLIAELIPNEQRTGGASEMLFGLNMMIHTPAGDVYTMAQYRGWLTSAGFRKIRRVPAAGISPLILATK